MNPGGVMNMRFVMNRFVSSSADEGPLKDRTVQMKGVFGCSFG